MRVLKFRQECFIKKYIETNTKKRQEATTDFENNFFKLLNNACFGKTMENLRNRISVTLVSDENKAKFYTSKFNFRKFTIFTENMVAVSIGKSSILWNNIGAAILDLSKIELYEYHYDVIVPKYKRSSNVQRY